MKTIGQHITLLSMALLLGLGLSSCSKDRALDGPDGRTPSNLTITVGSGPTSRGGGPARTEPLPADVARGLQLFAFTDATQPLFSHYLPVSEVTGQTVKSNAPAGDWSLAMSYFRSEPTSRIAPVSGVAMDASPMFKYTSGTTGAGNAEMSTSAPEIFRTQQKVSIIADQNTIANASIARNVAMVQLVISKSTMGIDKNAAAGSHKVYLYGVPSTISYGGKLLKTVAGAFEVDPAAPDTLTTPLEGRFALSDHPETGYLKSDTVNFIIPAHQGTDFWTRDANGLITGVNPNPTDITTLKMRVSIDLERPGGSRYQKSAEIPVVAQANKILRVSVTVNAGIEVGTSVLPWNYIDIDENVGQITSKGAWVYVKQGSTRGTGLSWSDALGAINKGIELAQSLKAAGGTVHGVLIAGGASRIYAESINVTTSTAGIRLYGGWEGTPGTELVAVDNADYPRQPQTSTARKLSTHKAIIRGNVTVNDKITYIDGLKITGVTSGTALTLGATTNSLVANAIEITGNTSPQAFSSQSTHYPWLTNLLIADNPESSLTISANNVLMVNATIARNKNIEINDGGFINCVFWGNTGTVTFYSAYPNADNSATDALSIDGMVRLNSVNNGVLAPLFNLPKYSVSGANSPLINRGTVISWWEPPTSIPDMFGINKDIDGNPRTTTTSKVDIGAYQSSLQSNYHPLVGTPVEWKSGAGDWGYVGTFHRAAETTERLIVGPHASGEWSAYVENGADWISLDLDAAGTNSGRVSPNTSVAGAAPNATTASGAQGVRFRVGLRTPLWGGATSHPRYGTIIVTWNNGTTLKQSRIYVRQGEMEDYLYSGRTGAVRFSPYNLTAATFESSLSVNGGKFTQYPSQCGGYFQWMNEINQRFAYAPSGAAATWNSATPYYEAYWTENELGASLVVATNHETCPVGYRRVNDGATNDEPTGVSEMRQSLWANPASATATNTFGGYYADGFFDQNTIRSASGNNGAALSAAGTGNNVAYRGRLFYNPATNASLFFPATGQRKSADGAIENAGVKGYYWSSSSTKTTTPATSPSSMATDTRSAAAPIRCVKN